MPFTTEGSDFWKGSLITQQSTGTEVSVDNVAFYFADKIDQPVS